MAQGAVRRLVGLVLGGVRCRLRGIGVRVARSCHVCVGAVAVGAIGIADVVEVGADDREGCVA